MAIVTNEVIPTQPKSEQAKQAAIDAFLDLEGPQARPFGSQRDENFGMPRNYIPPPARVFVVNHSRTHPWKRLIIPVSATRGADERLEGDRELQKRYTVDAIYRQVEQGRDMNKYYEGMQPKAINIRIPGGPNGSGGSLEGRYRAIVPAANEETAVLEVEVPEGTWDLYLGNFDRMRGYDSPAAMYDRNGNLQPPDLKVIEAEKQRLAVFWRKRHNPVFKYTVDGVTEDMHNPYGCLEFIRRTVVAMKEPVDQAYLTSLDLVEVL